MLASPIHLRAKLQALYWKADKPAVKAVGGFWEDSLRYPYLPRLKDRGVLAQAIVKGAGTRDFFGTAYGQTGEKFEGFKLSDANVQLDDTLLLIEPAATKAYEAANSTVIPPGPELVVPPGPTPPDPTWPGPGPTPPIPPIGPGPGPTLPKAKSFHGSADVTATSAKVRLVQIAEEIIALLNNDPNATVTISVEIAAEYPHGVSEQIKRAVSETAPHLGFKTATWE